MRVIAVYVEDATQEVVLNLGLLRGVQERLRQSGIVLRFHVARDIAKMGRKAGRFAVNELRNPETIGVFFLRDVHAPTHQATAVADDLRARIHKDVEQQSRVRVRVHVAPPEVEAWLLADRDALRTILSVSTDCSAPDPEQYEGGVESKERVEALFDRHMRRWYRSTVDGGRIARAADPVVVARRCPHFKAFANDLLAVAGLPPLY